MARRTGNPHSGGHVEYGRMDAPRLGVRPKCPPLLPDARIGMNCTIFLEHFSSWVDGDMDPDLRDRANAHVAGCVDCQKYEEVYLRGTDLLRSLDEDIDVDEDIFRSSLEHRILRVRRQGVEAAAIGSGAPFVSILAMTVVMLSVAWIPVIMVLTEPTVELAPIAAEVPPPRSNLQPLALPAVQMSGTASNGGIRTVPLEIRNTVPPASDLMRQYAPVLQPYRAVATDGID